MSDVTLEEVHQELQEVKQLLKEQQGGKQPDADEQITVWKNGGPGHKKIGKVITAAKQTDTEGMQRVATGEVESIVERGRTRTLEVMRELANKHPDIRYKNFGGNRGAYLYWQGK